MQNIVSFSCSFDNLLLKTVTVFICGNQILKWRTFEKKKPIIFFYVLDGTCNVLAFFFSWKPFFFFNHHGKDTKFPSAHILLTKYRHSVAKG